jgi:hypothetical protein
MWTTEFWTNSADWLLKDGKRICILEFNENSLSDGGPDHAKNLKLIIDTLNKPLES